MTDLYQQLWGKVAERAAMLIGTPAVGSTLTVDTFAKYVNTQLVIVSSNLSKKSSSLVTQDMVTASANQFLAKLLDYVNKSTDSTDLVNLMIHTALPSAREWYTPSELKEIQNILRNNMSVFIPRILTDNYLYTTAVSIITADGISKNVLISFLRSVTHVDQLIFYNPLTLKVRADIEVENDNIRGKVLSRESIYQCTNDKCAQWNVSYISIQTKSADEPTDDFCTCGDCGTQFWMRG